MLRLCALFVLLCTPLAAAQDFSGPIRVIDADTIDVGTTRVRLHGIDAPEMDQTCLTGQNTVIECGRWATDQVRARFQNRLARCTPIETDQYGRTVARCVVGDVDMGREIVSLGLAFAYRRYSTAYVLDEKGAAVNDRGLHAMRVQSPAQFRASGAAPAPAPQAPAQDCVIKGNISKNGYIYHVPGQEFYTRTRIDTARGERWFCTAAEARAAGWRPARR
ncbi:thermonuclease family protein [Pseudosulfitobacter koreensis]|uniref:Thermonuclease family protein n=1 Tax=Pseudosulfitobacter koreensis TaxID=2968472 RepID=A0ABT1Z1X7_9RHOB|nr:thermonuclease family protein [Pseudosulfitobacter koreense]MCR8827123.1 thermonuclease family protein [Pseudosulfitobacter koreense]